MKEKSDESPHEVFQGPYVAQPCSDNCFDIVDGNGDVAIWVVGRERAVAIVGLPNSTG